MTDYTEHTPTDTLVVQKVAHNYKSDEERHRVVIECDGIAKYVRVNGQLMRDVESIQFDGFDADGIPMAIIRVMWPEVTVKELDKE